MQTINVQFSDDTDSTVVAYFAGPQDPTDYPHQGTLPTTDPRWAAFYNQVPVFIRGGLPAPG